MDKFVMIDGKKYRLVPEEPVKNLTGYERAARGKDFFSASPTGHVTRYTEQGTLYENLVYDTANYYTNENIADDNVRADRLMRRLRRYAAMHGGMVPRKHLDAEDQKYFISCGENGELYAGAIYGLWDYFGAIFFSDVDSAQQAIEEFRPELEWYFTEYEPQLI